MEGKFDPELMEHLPASVKFICHNGAGYDQIDVDACSAKRITVTYAPDPVTDAMAHLGVFLLLGALRQLNSSLTSLREGNFKKNIGFGHDPRGKKLSILGMGKIGQAMVRRMEPFGMNVFYHSRRALKGGGEAKYVTFKELLIQSDVLSTHVPLSKAPQHLIRVDEVKHMKPGYRECTTRSAVRRALDCECQLLKCLPTMTASLPLTRQLQSDLQRPSLRYQKRFHEPARIWNDSFV